MSDSVQPHRQQPLAPPSLGFSRQEYWSGLPFPSPMRESEIAQSCPILSNPMDCSLPGSSVHGILQARILEWVAISFSMIRHTPTQTPYAILPLKLLKIFTLLFLNSFLYCKLQKLLEKSSNHPYSCLQVFLHLIPSA